MFFGTHLAPPSSRAFDQRMAKIRPKFVTKSAGNHLPQGACGSECLSQFHPVIAWTIQKSDVAFLPLRYHGGVSESKAIVEGSHEFWWISQCLYDCPCLVLQSQTLRVAGQSRMAYNYKGSPVSTVIKTIKTLYIYICVFQYYIYIYTLFKNTDADFNPGGTNNPTKNVQTIIRGD